MTLYVNPLATFAFAGVTLYPMSFFSHSFLCDPPFLVFIYRLLFTEMTLDMNPLSTTLLGLSGVTLHPMPCHSCTSLLCMIFILLMLVTARMIPSPNTFHSSSDATTLNWPLTKTIAGKKYNLYYTTRSKKEAIAYATYDLRYFGPKIIRRRTKSGYSYDVYGKLRGK